MSDRAEQRQQFADELLQAYETKQPVPPLRDRLEGMDLDDAYAVQQLQEQALLEAGRTIVGRKIGLTSFAMQKQLGVDSPDFGFVMDDQIVYDDARFEPGKFISPKVEPELGLYLKKDLQGPGVTLADAVDAIGSVHAAIEIIDSRIADWNIKLVDTVADNASCGAIAVAKDPMDLDLDDLVDVPGKLLINGESVGEGTGADVMGHPAAPLQWLANLLGERGIALKAGQVILTGSFTGAVAVEAGTSATADFGQLGQITINFD